MDIAQAPIRKIRIGDLKPAEYNPRVDLKPGDPDYENIRAGMVDPDIGLVEPLVWNERSGTLVGGHQRLKVLREAGATDDDEISVSVVDLPPGKERSLNILLNKAVGRWDEPRLLALVDELGEMKDAGSTGWSEADLKVWAEARRRL